MTIFDVVLLVFVAAAATAIVLTRTPLSQAILLSFYGLLLAFLFFEMQAPDVALSQIVVGTVALPLMVVVTLARVKKHSHEENK